MVSTTSTIPLAGLVNCIHTHLLGPLVSLAPVAIYLHLISTTEDLSSTVTYLHLHLPTSPSYSVRLALKLCHCVLRPDIVPFGRSCQCGTLRSVLSLSVKIDSSYCPFHLLPAFHPKKLRHCCEKHMPLWIQHHLPRHTSILTYLHSAIQLSLRQSSYSAVAS